MAGTSKIKGNTKTFVPPKPATPAELRRRWKKKQGQVQTLANNMQKLRYNITSDMKSDDEKVFLTACVVSLMDKSAERVGNDDSASKGHRGITGLLKSQVKIEGNSIHLRYTGKSGVKQEKVVTDERLSNALRKAIGISTSKYLFCTSDGFKIKNDRVNRYLSDFGITAKDIRGFSANKWLIQKLHANDIADDEKQRKKDFIRMSKAVAAKVGHGHTMLKNQYLIPGLEEEYITNGRIMDIKDIDGFKGGGAVKKMEAGGEIGSRLKGKKLTLLHNTEKAPYLGKRFGQDVEPAGYYAIEQYKDYGDRLPTIEVAEFEAINPLIVPVDSNTLVSWKYDLSQKQKAKGKKLSDKLIAAGHDCIITVYENGDTGEIIVLDTSRLIMKKHESGGVIVDSDNFKKWFADSKAVDENGQPAKVYHGTESDPFYTYDKTTVRDKFGFFFTDDKDYAEMFGKAHVPYYLSMQKPYVITQEKWDAIRDAHAKDSVWFENWRNQLIGKGHDGLIVKFSFISFAGTQIRNPEIYAVFESNQVKIADGSNTTFDANSPDVRYAGGGMTIYDEYNGEAPESAIDMLKAYADISIDFNDFMNYLAMSDDQERRGVIKELKLQKETTSEFGLANRKKLETFYEAEKKEINAKRKEWELKNADGGHAEFDWDNPDMGYADGGITIAEENDDDELPESTIDMLKRYVEISRNFDAFMRYIAISDEHEQQGIMDELRLEKATTSEIGMANKKKLEAFYKEQKREINARRKERRFQVEQIKEQDFLEKITNMALESEAQMQQNIEKYEERKKNAVRIPVSLFEDLPKRGAFNQDYQVPTDLFSN